MFEELSNRTNHICKFYKDENKELHLTNELGVQRGVSDCLWIVKEKAADTENLLDVFKIYRRAYENCTANENNRDALLHFIGSLRGAAYCIEELTGEEIGETLSTMVLIDKAFDYNAFVNFIVKQNEILSEEKMPWDK